MEQQKKVRFTNGEWIFLEHGRMVTVFDSVSELINWLQERGIDVIIGEIEVV